MLLLQSSWDGWTQWGKGNPTNTFTFLLHLTSHHLWLYTHVSHWVRIISTRNPIIKYIFMYFICCIADWNLLSILWIIFYESKMGYFFLKEKDSTKRRENQVIRIHFWEQRWLECDRGWSQLIWGKMTVCNEGGLVKTVGTMRLVRLDWWWNWTWCVPANWRDEIQIRQSRIELENFRQQRWWWSGKDKTVSYRVAMT